MRPGLKTKHPARRKAEEQATHTLLNKARESARKETTQETPGNVTDNLLIRAWKVLCESRSCADLLFYTPHETRALSGIANGGSLMLTGAEGTSDPLQLCGEPWVLGGIWMQRRGNSRASP